MKIVALVLVVLLAGLAFADNEDPVDIGFNSVDAEAATILL